MKQRIILRADASAQIATGHVFRLLALAEMLKSTYEVFFCTQTNNQQILNTIATQVDHLIILPDQFKYCLPSEKETFAEVPFDLQHIIHENDIVVTDGYWFRENYQQSIKKTGAKLIMIDDFANQYFYADAVINHAPGLTEDLYQGETHTKFYLGLSYALIRKSFFEQPKLNYEKKTNNVFVAFGGSDPYGLSVKYTEHLLKYTSNKIHLLSSTLFKQTMLEQIIQLHQQFGERLIIHNNLNAKELIHVLDNCIYAIVSSSTILFECLARGLKCLIGYYTENQILIYNGFVQEHFCIGLGDLRICDKNSLNKFIKKVNDVTSDYSLTNSKPNILDIINNLC